MTKAIDFIAADAAKAKGQTGKAGLVAAVTLALVFVLAIALRPDVEDVGVFYATQSAVLGGIFFAFLWLHLAQRIATDRRRWVLRGTVLLALLVSLAHEGLHPFSTQTSLVRFWKETGGCFSKGVVVGVGAGALLTLAAFRFLPVPDRRWQFGIATAASLAGLVMLNLNCPSTVATHIVLAHWAQGIVVTAVISSAQAALFRFKLRQVLGQATAGSGAVDFLED